MEHRVSDASNVFDPPLVGADSVPRSQRAFSRYAWGILAYLFLVILFGAWVRISGSGAGCGDHWPTCHGEIVPRSPMVETIIEYTHRLTSGILGPMAIAMVIWAFRGAGKRKLVKRCATATLLLIFVEALIGAGLVLGELVADDDSVARAWAVALHLSNTLLLTAAAAMTAWFGAGRVMPSLSAAFPARRSLIVGIVGIVLVSATGAVTALGDTLFPVRPSEGMGLLAQVRAELDPGAHFLVQLRLVHPVLACVVAGALLWVARAIGRWLEHLLDTASADDARRKLVRDGDVPRAAVLREALLLGRGLSGLIVVQLVAGAVNIALGAPAWMQLTHLLLAQGVWLTAVLLYLAAARAADVVQTQAAAGYNAGPTTVLPS